MKITKKDIIIVLLILLLFLIWGCLMELSNITRELQVIDTTISNGLNNISFAINPQRAFLGEELHGDLAYSVSNHSIIKQVRKNIKKVDNKMIIDEANELLREIEEEKDPLNLGI